MSVSDSLLTDYSGQKLQSLLLALRLLHPLGSLVDILANAAGGTRGSTQACTPGAQPRSPLINTPSVTGHQLW